MDNLMSRTRDHIKHITVTGYVVNRDRTKMLMIHHKKLDKWLPPGGHLDSNEVPHEGAIREVYEETGVKATVVKDEYEVSLDLKGEFDIQIPRPYAFTYQVIPANSKEEEHIHLDLLYWLEADERSTIAPSKREVHGVGWYGKHEILNDLHTFDTVSSFAKKNLI